MLIVLIVVILILVGLGGYGWRRNRRKSEGSKSVVLANEYGSARTVAMTTNPLHTSHPHMSADPKPATLAPEYALPDYSASGKDKGVYLVPAATTSATTPPGRESVLLDEDRYVRDPAASGAEAEYASPAAMAAAPPSPLKTGESGEMGQGDYALFLGGTAPSVGAIPPGGANAEINPGILAGEGAVYAEAVNTDASAEIPEYSLFKSQA